MELRTTSGVRLAPLPASPSPDYMAGEDGRIYSRLRHRGFGNWAYVDWHPVGSERARRSNLLVIDVAGRRVSLSLPRVICAAFHGMPESDACHVRHLDGDPNNNRADNLAWGTEQEAWADSNARRRSPDGVKHRLSPEERAHLRWALLMGLCSQRQAARALGLALSTVQGIVRGDGPAHVERSRKPAATAPGHGQQSEAIEEDGPSPDPGARPES